MKNSFIPALLFQFLIFLPVQAHQLNYSGRYFENKADSLYLYGHYDSVLYYYRKAESKFVLDHNNAGIISCKIKKGNYFTDVMQTDSAEHIVHELEREIATLKGKSPEFSRQFELLKGSLYYVTGQLDKAIGIYTKCLNQISDQTLNGNRQLLLLNLGMCYEQKGQNDSTNYYYNEVLHAKQMDNAADSLMTFDIFSRMIRFYVSKEQWKETLALMDFCSTVINNFSLDNSYKSIYYYDGEAYYLFNKAFYSEALDNIGVAEQILNKYSGSHNFMIGLMYYLKAKVFYRMDQFDRALNYYNLAASFIKKNKGLDKYKSDFLINLGDCYYHRFDYKNALLYNMQSLQTKKLQNIFKGRIYNTIGNCYYKMGDMDEAEQSYKLAERNYLKEKSPNINGLINIYSSLYLIYKKRNDIKKQREYLHKAYQIAITHPKMLKIELGYLYEYFTIYYNSLGDFTNALKYIQQSLHYTTDEFESRDIYSNPRVEQIVYKNLAVEQLYNKALSLYWYYKKVTHNINDLKFSLETYKLSSTLAEKVFTSILDEDYKVKYAASNVNILKSIIILNWQLYIKTKNKEYLDEAFKYTEKEKAITLLSYLNDNQAMNYAGIPDTLINYEKELKKRMGEIDFKLQSGESLGDEDVQSKDAARSELNTLNIKYEKLVELMEKKYPRYYDLKYNLTVSSTDEVQKSLKSDQVLAEYVLDDSYLYIFVVTPDSSRLICEDNLHIKPLIVKLNKMLSGYNYGDYDLEGYRSFAELGDTLYKVLIKPFDKLIRGKRLIIVPDAELNTIPFEVLLTNKVKNTGYIDYKQLPYLIRKNAISYAYSASILSFQKKDKIRGTHLLAFAPDYKTWAGQKNVNNSDKSELRGIVNNLLPGAIDEVKEITKIYYGKRFIGNNATETNFKQDASKYDIIHMAMHTALDDRNPMYSELIFSAPDNSKEDGLLHTFEIYGMKIPANLVVLSGCNTGAGQVHQGEGILSLARSFVYAGSASLILTQWSVADKASSELMNLFYLSLSKKEPKDVALQKAKLTYLQDADPLKSHPYYWAAYENFGDTRPIYFSSEYGYVFTGILSLLLLIEFFAVGKKLRKLF